MIRTLTITAAIVAASTLSALADGKQATLAVINMAIAEGECGMSPNAQEAQITALQSLEFTGLERAQYIKTMGDMVAIKTNEMYADRSIGRFCVRMAQIYAGAK